VLTAGIFCFGLTMALAWLRDRRYERRRARMLAQAGRLLDR
jgi:hypothetical protein